MDQNQTDAQVVLQLWDIEQCLCGREDVRLFTVSAPPLALVPA